MIPKAQLEERIAELEKELEDLRALLWELILLIIRQKDEAK
jgi:hypothetical protein